MSAAVLRRQRQHLRLSAGLALAAALGAGALPAAAQADGRAQAGAGLGVYSTWDLDPQSTLTGTAWRDGGVVGGLNTVNDFPSGNLQVHDGAVSARVELQVQSALLQAGGGPALPVSGYRMVEANLAAGTLRLQSSSGYVGSAAPFAQRLAYAQGHAFAELFQNFDVRWALDHAGPVEVSLGMTLNGSVLRNDGSDGWVAGLGAYLHLGNVNTGLPPLMFPIDPLARFEGSLVDQQLRIGGGFVNSQCFAAAGYCEAFVNVYAAIDIRGRNLADGSIDYHKGAAHDFDFGHTAQIALTSSPGVSVLRVDNLGQVLPNYAWVNPSPVPEPGSALLLAGGLAALAGWAGRRRRA